MNKFEIDMTLHRAEKELDKMIEYREEVDSKKRLGYTYDSMMNECEPSLFRSMYNSIVRYFLSLISF